MRIFAEKLPEHLQHQLMSVYLLFGNEPLLLQESRLSIAQKAKAQGFTEIYRYQADSTLDWHQVFDHFQAFSLFSSQQLVELTLPDGNMNAQLTGQLLALGDMLHPDTILVVIGNKLTKAQENTKWFKALATHGCLVNCLTPDLNRLPQFVMQRCRKLKLVPDPEALQMLAQWHEGNLLALAQSLEKLALLYPDGQLTLIRVEASLSRHNHFTVYNWTDALLDGKSNRCQRILRQLEAEGTEPVLLLRSVQKELRLLTTLHAQQQDASLHTLMDKHRIWKNKRSLYVNALNRLSTDKLYMLIQALSHIELSVKTRYDINPWPLLQAFSLQFTQAGLTPAVPD
ncbi:DNA polymerase III subunit delta [Vibrio spartinae]|uniref:DNA polymerase III subunit delta n=1 Tax=Vibrio spartinae TaxID=1918945 RepID=A0A1N6M862_9VIBR|nr:DNA polymerase III subunit delta [Vibrio spartinae]QMV13721.1 DNA polymerase III subunit delta [Vibrio spartinae]SIO95622.1 DNA polymerase III subunit delta [Vibrio spartinae]